MLESEGPLRRRLAENLKLLLEQHDWSQQELAERAGISQKNVSDMCRAGHDPRITQVEKAANALGHPAWALLAFDLRKDATSRPSDMLRLLELFVAANAANRTALLNVAEAISGKQTDRG